MSNDPHLRLGNFVNGSVYNFLLKADYDDPAGVLDAQGALTDFMDRNGIEYTKTNQYQDYLDLILAAQPRWLNVDVKFVQDQMLPDAEQHCGGELLNWLRAEFLKRFRFVVTPPEWIQSPEWPIGKNGPLVFLGQLDINGYFHDVATVYIFHDPVYGKCESVIQVY